MLVYSALSTRVLLGAHNIRESEATQVEIVAASAYIHEDYDSRQIVNDIAVLQLSEPAPLNGK